MLMVFPENLCELCAWHALTICPPASQHIHIFIYTKINYWIYYQYENGRRSEIFTDGRKDSSEG